MLRQEADDRWLYEQRDGSEHDSAHCLGIDGRIPLPRVSQIDANKLEQIQEIDQTFIKKPARQFRGGGVNPLDGENGLMNLWMKAERFGIFLVDGSAAGIVLRP
ncbi:hypothetical protein D3877_08595 [Azospirillum cavernae]|uniref:Uncharacterized protein n=1 Tax=Azospirillum cavernae TaxID=2320860 RepID=A0A418W3P5_9PROT|nr:hypothetical protein D3877_08595 [Azospirillum cavernae]